MSQNVSELLGASMAKVREMVDANTVVGTPISAGDGTTLIPISKISFAMASGGSFLTGPSMPDEARFMRGRRRPFSPRGTARSSR